MNRNFIFASSLLSNTIIGAGIFSLPFVFAAVGLGRGLLYLVFFAAVYSVIHLMYARILQEGEENHELVYFAEKYLGKKAGIFVAYLVICELLLVLTVYLILAPSFFHILFGVSGDVAVILFWAASSFFIFVNFEWIEWIATLSVVSIIIIVLIVFQHSISHGFSVPLVKGVGFTTLLLPFGPLLFALNGRPGISKVIEVWRSAKKKGESFLLRNAVIWGTVVPAILYCFFVISVLRLTPTPSEDAISGLFVVMPGWIITVFGVLGLIAIWNPYFMLGTNIKDILREDFGFSRITSSFFILSVPLTLYFLGVSEFIGAIGFIGGALLAIEGIVIVTMWRRAFPNSRWRAVSFILYFVFLCAIIYQIAQLFV